MTASVFLVPIIIFGLELILRENLLKALRWMSLLQLVAIEMVFADRGSEFENSLVDKPLPPVESEHRTK